MTLTERVTVPSAVMAREVGGETVILDLQSGMYYGLDGVGTRIWALLAEGRTLGEALAVIVEEYEVMREEAEKDLVRLVEALQEKGLVSVSG